MCTLCVSTPDQWLWSVLLGWRHFGHAGEPQSQAGADGLAAAGRQETATHFACSFFSWLCHFCFTSDESEKTDTWAVLWRERKETRVGLKSIGCHRQQEEGGEGCETEGRGLPGLRAWHGRAEQTACIQPSRWGREGEWWYALGLRVWQEGPEVGWEDVT